MFKAILGIAPTILSDRFVMNFDVNGYDTRGLTMELYLLTLRKDMHRNRFIYGLQTVEWSARFCTTFYEYWII